MLAQRVASHHGQQQQQGSWRKPTFGEPVQGTAMQGRRTEELRSQELGEAIISSLLPCLPPLSSLSPPLLLAAPLLRRSCGDQLISD